MAQYTYNVSMAPAGICPPKLGREIKVALALGKKPKVFYVGQTAPGTDNLISGEITVKVRELTPAELATLEATIVAHDPCEPFGGGEQPEVGTDLDDLDDFLHAMPGTVVYVRDLPRIAGGGVGTLVYRTGNGFRRVSDDTRVDVPTESERPE